MGRRKKRRKPVKKLRRKHKASGLDKLLGLILMVSGIIVGIAVVMEPLRDQEIKETWKPVTGTVTGSHSYSQSTSRGSYKVKQFWIEYPAGDRVGRAAGKGSHATGTTLDGYVSPTTPRRFRTEEQVNSWNGKWWLIATPILFLAGLSVMTDGRNPDWEEIKEEGKAQKENKDAKKRKRNGRKRRR